ncbi:MAG TPA: hypothetical protein VED59_05480 [Acidimicrobiales bacterium]|nr:hypothetical protein [Acidimicrobiales bacterium]
MRTTLNLDPDVLEAAKAIAASEGRTTGEVLSELARRGLSPQERTLEEDNGFPVFRVARGAPPITAAMVRTALEQA